MEKEFATLPAPAQRLLGSSTDALVLGPLWLLWHGGWRTALRCYLPLVLADACSRGLVGFGMAPPQRAVGADGHLGYGFLPGCRFCLQCVRQFPLAPAHSVPRRHWVAPLVWLAGAGLLLFFAMELGGCM